MDGTRWGALGAALLGSTMLLGAAPALAQAKTGAALFSESGCAGCHGGEGGGGMGPALASNANLADEAMVMATIHDGRGSMPGFGARLSEQEIKALSDYIRTAFGNAYEVAQASPAAELAAPAPAPAPAAPPKPQASSVLVGEATESNPVTFERLKGAADEPQNWLMAMGRYAGYSYSSLDQVNRDTVKGLKLAYTRAIGGEKSSGLVQTAPLVVDGYMYVSNGMAEILKFDVRSGDEARLVWKNDPAAAAGSKQGGSITLLGDYVYNVTRDMRMLKIDAKTGETVWDISVRNPENVNANELSSAAPLAIGDTIIMSAAGSALRSWIGGWDAESGELKWRWYSVPAPGEPGHETWKDDHNAWLTGGVGIWTIPTYDPETNLIYFGTGEAQPWTDPEFSPGDNLYSISTVALSPDTGEMAWYFQELPDDSWDYDSVSPRILHDATINGETRKVVSNFTRSGIYYTLDRETGEFLDGGKFLDVNWTEGLDPETGKPVEYDPTKDNQVYANNTSLRPGEPTTSQNVCPAHAGMPTWWPPSFDPQTGKAWVQALTGCENQVMPASVDRTKDLRGDPLLWAGAGGSNSPVDNPADIRGLIIGVDAVTGQQTEVAQTTFWMGNGLLGTAGNLLFSGHRDGRFAAYDKDTLEEVWHFNTGAAIGGPPMTFSVDGQQYVAIVTGGNTGRVQHPALKSVSTAPMLFVFTL